MFILRIVTHKKELRNDRRTCTITIRKKILERKFGVFGTSVRKEQIIIVFQLGTFFSLFFATLHCYYRARMCFVNTPFCILVTYCFHSTECTVGCVQLK